MLERPRAAHTALAGLAEQRDRFEPAEDLFHPFPRSLADLVPGMPMLQRIGRAATDLVRTQAPPHPRPARLRLDLILKDATAAVIRPVHVPVDGGGVPG